jgi:protocatechuate 3,4-dioxygenase beta subunit
MARKLAIIPVLLLAGLVIGSSVAQAQTASRLFVLNAKVETTGKIYLTWTKPPGDSVQYYLLFRAQMPNSLAFTRIDSTTKNEFVDIPVAASNYVAYVYYVEARMKGGSTLRSNMALVNIWPRPQTDVVRITSEPVKSATVGVLYTYQVKAVSSDSTARLKYALSLRPFFEMTIVDSTGLIKWTPRTRGMFRIVVVVISTKGGKASQEYTLTVSGSTGTIAGTVTDTTGKPIAKVVVKLYGRYISVLSNILPFEYSAVTDSLGKYSISRLDSGTYLARAIPMRPDYLEQWYDGKASVDKADPIEVKDSIPVAIDFKLKAKAAIPKYTVSGTVLDESGNPIKESWVVFSRAGFSFNSSKLGGDDWSSQDDNRDLFDMEQMRMVTMSPGMPSVGIGGSAEVNDFRLDGTSAYVSKVRVDSEGKYSVTLPQGSYIAFAFAPGYHKLFYDNRSDFLSADIIKLTSDLTDINFVLKAVNPLATGVINGSVVDTVSGAGVPARVVAFRARAVGHDTLLVPKAYHTDTDSTGAFSLKELPPGDYIILAIPLGHFTPSYYSTVGPTTRWKEATKVNVDGNNVAGITIFVRPAIRSATGYTWVRGNVRSATGTSGSLGKRHALVGIEGSIVYAADNTTGLVAGYGVTDADGAFAITELAPGPYTLSVDKIDYDPAIGGANPTYDASGNPVPATVSLDIAVTDVEDNPIVPTGYVLGQNYPNPFNPTTNIVFSIPQTEKVTLTIYNMLGQKIATVLDGSFLAGTHVVTWNGRDGLGRQLPSGVYFYRLSTSRFSEARKMVLLK